MPELPEVEWMSRALARRIAGQRIEDVMVRDPSLFHGASDADALGRLLCGADVVGVHRRAKTTLVTLQTVDGPRWLVVEYRMTGRWAWAEERYGRAGVRLSSGAEAWFCDTRRFGRWNVLDAAARAQREAAVGPEPWPAPLTGAALAERFTDARAPLKTLLMEPARVAGLGNIAASEVLFRAGIHPEMRPRAVRPDQWDRLARAIVAFVDETLAHAEQADAIAWMQDGHAPAESGFRVYGRQGAPCVSCGTAVERARHGGRSTFYCPQCQPMA